MLVPQIDSIKWENDLPTTSILFGVSNYEYN